MAILAVLLGFVLSYEQLKKTSSTQALQAVLDRLQVFIDTEKPITAGDLAILESIPEEYFDIDTYECFYKGDERLLRRYLLRSRHYHFLLYAYTAEKHFDDLIDVDLDLWTRELLASQEFLHVHNRQKRYYPEYGVYLDSMLEEMRQSSERTPAATSAPQTSVLALTSTRRASAPTQTTRGAVSSLPFWSIVLRGLTLLCVAVGASIAIRQLKKVQRGFELQSLSDRFNAYFSSEQAATDEDVKTIRHLFADNFDSGVYDRRYRHDFEKCRRYLIMQRRYHYIFYSWLSEDRFPIFFDVDVSLWLGELCEFEEFRDVHFRYRRYYQRFAPLVEEKIDTSEFRQRQLETYRNEYLKRDASEYREVIDEFLKVPSEQVFALLNVSDGTDLVDYALAEPQFLQLWEAYPEVFDASTHTFDHSLFSALSIESRRTKLERRLKRKKVQVSTEGFWDLRRRYYEDTGTARIIDRFLLKEYGTI